MILEMVYFRLDTIRGVKEPCVCESIRGLSILCSSDTHMNHGGSTEVWAQKGTFLREPELQILDQV